jgi:hypothetical protein
MTTFKVEFFIEKVSPRRNVKGFVEIGSCWDIIPFLLLPKFDPLQGKRPLLDGAHLPQPALYLVQFTGPNI